MNGSFSVSANLKYHKSVQRYNLCSRVMESTFAAKEKPLLYKEGSYGVELKGLEPLTSTMPL